MVDFFPQVRAKGLRPPRPDAKKARMTKLTRFAPSPTGRLHLGHVYAARVAHSLARESPEGQFLLRHEDIDGSRVREEFYDDTEADLKWLGLIWDDAPLRQTERLEAYEATLDELRDRELVYPCFCTRKEIQEEWSRMASAPQGPEGPVYPGTCLRLSPAERQAKLDAGLSHAWRLDSGKAAALAGPLAFQDLRHGIVPVRPELLGDVVLARKDIGTAYHLAVVIDDAFQKITHVTRGDDLLHSTHVHRLLQTLLGLPEPVYLHHRLMRDEEGKRLAKRADSKSIASLRAAGHSPEQVLAMADPDI